MSAHCLVSVILRTVIPSTIGTGYFSPLVSFIHHTCIIINGNLKITDFLTCMRCGGHFHHPCRSPACPPRGLCAPCHRHFAGPSSMCLKAKDAGAHHNSFKLWKYFVNILRQKMGDSFKIVNQFRKKRRILNSTGLIKC